MLVIDGFNWVFAMNGGEVPVATQIYYTYCLYDARAFHFLEYSIVLADIPAVNSLCTVA